MKFNERKKRIQPKVLVILIAKFPLPIQLINLKSKLILKIIIAILKQQRKENEREKIKNNYLLLFNDCGNDNN